MRRRISLLVAATTSAVIIAFLIPLAMLVRTLAEDRAVAGASQEAQGVATLVAGVNDENQLRNLVGLVDQRSPRATSVLLPDGTLIGTAPPGSLASNAPAISRARGGAAFILVGPQSAQVVVPVVTERGTVVVRTAISSSDLRQGVATAWLTFAGLGAVLMALAVVGADQLGRRVSAPVSELAAVAHRLRGGELDARAVPRGPVETVELGRALNRLADRIGELLTAEREAVADLSHRLRTPVTALRLDAGAVTEPDLADRLRDHIAHLERTVDAVVKDARRPVRGTLGRSCDAASVVRDRVAFWSALAVDQGRDLKISIPSAATPAAIDANDLLDVVDALVDNVFAHTPDGTAFAVSLTQSDPALVRLEVADSGPGAAHPDVMARGHSTADSTGLGLDIVRRAAIAAGGDLVVARSPSGGMLAVVTLG
ncbi:MAG: HAMP domain-containing histidine kinase, partial [Actinobacteria bacterium]|nr:HAMP domain-containing histidine kinase [Actinomycetota bacterium]